MKFTKMHGLGNDYIYVNCFSEKLPYEPKKLSPIISDRHFGVGGDGMILICPSDVADAKMQMFNADGSESGMCGNGIRCVAKYLYDFGIVPKNELTIESGGKVLTLQLTIENGKMTLARVDMGEPVLVPDHVPTLLRSLDGYPEHAVVDVPLTVAGKVFAVSAVSMGNPHCVTFVEELTDDQVLGFGPKIETDSAFPQRVNVEFVKIISPTELRMRVWERGSGETLACGTGACAVAVAGVLSGRSERRVQIELLGGRLGIEWSEADNHVLMTGPATTVFTGDWQP
ncbi:MAG: diaminopimelate epimerase [Planctomycetaceae bacterium]|nr:diaminopimelate epimerase [Planctomycetaceae bacterium]